MIPIPQLVHANDYLDARRPEWGAAEKLGDVRYSLGAVAIADRAILSAVLKGPHAG